MPENEEKTVTALAPQPQVQPAPRVSMTEMLSLVRDTELVAAYGKEIVLAQLAINRFDQDWRLATCLAKSGLFADSQSVEQAMTKIQLGRSWNMSEADAMQHVYFVNGKPAVQNEYLGAKMRDAGLDWDIEWHRDDNPGVTLWPRRLTPNGWSPIMERADGKEVPARVSFRKSDADRVKVKEDGKWIKLWEKSTYVAFPDDMYFWRAIARLRRRYATNILSGVMTRDEAEEIAPPPEPVAREKQSAEPSEFMPARSARRRGGVTEIPGTVAEAKAEEVKTDPVADKQPEPEKVLTDPAKPQTQPDPATPEKPTESGSVSTSTVTLPIAIAPWDSAQSMNASFRGQRERIGQETFTRILNSVPGFMFGPDSWKDPRAVEIFRDMESTTAEPAAAADKPKKLF